MQRASFLEVDRGIPTHFHQFANSVFMEKSALKICRGSGWQINKKVNTDLL